MVRLANTFPENLADDPSSISLHSSLFGYMIFVGRVRLSKGAHCSKLRYLYYRTSTSAALYLSAILPKLSLPIQKKEKPKISRHEFDPTLCSSSLNQEFRPI